MFASNNLSAADVAAVTGGNRNNGFGDGDGWWIILLALLFGWGTQRRVRRRLRLR